MVWRFTGSHTRISHVYALIQAHRLPGCLQLLLKLQPMILTPPRLPLAVPHPYKTCATVYRLIDAPVGSANAVPAERVQSGACFGNL